jgi:integrase
MPKRIKTKYPGVYYREARRIGGHGAEKVYYILFKKKGKTVEEKAGRQYADDMTPARAASVRAERIEGKRLSPKEIRKEIRAELRAAKEAAQNRWTIDRLWEKYKEGRPFNKTLLVDGGRYKNYIGPLFGNKTPKELILLNVDRLRIKLLKTKSPQTVKHVLALLERIVSFGVKRNLCEGIPFFISKPRTNNIKAEDLTPDELTRLIKAIDKTSYIDVANMMRMALCTGMRRGELFKLKWDDVDFHRGFIKICDPKGGPDQTIPLNDAARNVLLSQPKTESPYVFPGRWGGQRKAVNIQARKILDEAGLPKNFRPFHGLRHFFASSLASSGKVDMYVLQRLLTHKSPIMTQRYAHLRDDALRRASDLAADIVNDAVIGSENAEASPGCPMKGGWACQLKSKQNG